MRTYFTSDDSLNDILNYPGLMSYVRHMNTADAMALIPEEMRDLPLRMAFYRVDQPFWESKWNGMDEILAAANLGMRVLRGERRCLRIPQETPWDPEEEGADKEPFIITPDSLKSIGASGPEAEKRPAIIIVPGGGYEYVSIANEGAMMDDAFSRLGFRCFILNYRTAGRAGFPGPQKDLLLAAAYVEEHAAEYGVDPEQVSFMGFSAGAHLAASAAEFREELGFSSLRPPRALVLGYPVISFAAGLEHAGSFSFLAQGDESLRRKLSLENSAGMCPPTFMWACLDDPTVPPANAKTMKAALDEAGVLSALHLYETGGHGCGVAYNTDAWDWTVRAAEFMKDIERRSGKG